MKFLQTILFLISSVVFSQSNFEVRINAPDFEGDSVFISNPMSANHTEKLFNFSISKNENTQTFEGISGGFIRIKNQNSVTGFTDYPQPAVIFYSKNQSNIFFLEEGKLDLAFNKELEISVNSSANKEYKALQKILNEFNAKLKPFQNNNLEEIELKERKLRDYISLNPSSFVAFWEIANDYSKFGYHPIYLENLQLFDENVKNSFSYQELIHLLDLNKHSLSGNLFPEIHFEKNEISTTDFQKYKITLIDYWSTNCKPCIEDLPELVEIYTKYKEKGFNIISIADENKETRMNFANQILEKNNVKWKNYFDTNKEMPKKLNAAGYPLFILVDNEGKIVERNLGNLEKTKQTIQNFLDKSILPQAVAK